MVLLVAKDLTVRMGGRPICENLSFEIRAGECWGLLGSNGAGKTTLLHTLAGLRSPEHGEVLLRGQPLGGMKRKLVARQLGLLLQDSEDPFPTSVLESTLIGRHPYLKRWGWESPNDRKLARQALAKLGLDHIEQRLTTTLSGGERRRLAIATLLTQDPVLALLDEPTNHLDLHHQLRVLRLLHARNTSRDGGTLMVLHDINQALSFCDHLLLLFGDGDTLQGPAATVACQDNLERLYHHPLQAVSGPQGTLYVPL